MKFKVNNINRQLANRVDVIMLTPVDDKGDALPNTPGASINIPAGIVDTTKLTRDGIYELKLELAPEVV